MKQELSFQKKSLLLLPLLMVLWLGLSMTACSNDDDNTPDGVTEVDEPGVPKDGHQIVVIDESNFYIDNIRYTAEKDELSVTGYHPDFFKGEAWIVSELDYEGHHWEVKSIGKKAFESCEALTSVVIPEGVTSIGVYSF